jgi:spore maturation protein CgeB
MKLAFVGLFEGTHLGGSLARAARRLGIDFIKFDVADAFGKNQLLHSLTWHIADRRPLWMAPFSQNLIASCARARPDILIATGAASLTKSTLRRLRQLGIICVNYSSDDPWNPRVRANWYLRALPEYNVVFSTRQSNLGDFSRLGCTEVRYLPFGYDECLFPVSPEISHAYSYDVLFVGGADRDRVKFVTEFMRTGPPVTLVGGYWDRFPETRHYALGLKQPDEVIALTTAAKINLCLVRRANRDGHVMRSFEIGAIGACMLAEDTAEHRYLFGENEDCAVYFRNPADAALRARTLIANSEQRAALSRALQQRILNNQHTYRDRLLTILKVVEPSVARARPRH